MGLFLSDNSETGGEPRFARRRRIASFSERPPVAGTKLLVVGIYIKRDVDFIILILFLNFLINMFI